MGGLDHEHSWQPYLEPTLEDDKVEGMLIHVFGVKMPADILFPAPYSLIANDDGENAETYVIDSELNSEHTLNKDSVRHMFC
jgi:hypothetical protein